LSLKRGASEEGSNWRECVFRSAVKLDDQDCYKIIVHTTLKQLGVDLKNGQVVPLPT
jgi:hypothetical protein